MTDRQFFALLSATLLALFIWSGVAPRDRLTWALEVAPVIIGIAILAATYARFEFTRLVYALVWLHAAILLIGGHYTYAEMPVFSWLRDTFDLSRNHYDRLGHFAQGFFPAIIVRELLIRLSPLASGKWLFTLVTCVCLAISAFYELIEWWAALLTGSAATAFLATQGDVWDTQWDMFLALVGAIVSQLMLAPLHDRALKRLAR